jgi:phage terminase large subunit-like protein
VFRHRISGDDLEAEVVAQETSEGPVVRKAVNLNYRITIVPFFWIPEDTMREHEHNDGVPYSMWREQGLMTATEGVSIDYTRIYEDITAKILPMFPRLRSGPIGFDRAFATDIATDLNKFAGRNDWCQEVLQNHTHMTEPGYVFEALVKAKRVSHGGHRVLRNHIENVTVKKDDAGRLRPVKPKKASKHIDGVVASLMGTKILAQVPDAKRSIGVMVV